jgi:CubicO group peptidase (beta-lactamase class C family)
MQYAVLALAALSMVPAPILAETPNRDAVLAAIDADFERWAAENHVPGLVWGFVQDGKLAHVKAIGRQTALADGAEVTADTGFRIASMSKAFTAYAILRLRDAGKLRLDDPVWRHVPQVHGWAADLTVRDLLHHTAGFVTDDPWGDRQQVMSEKDFTALLQRGAPYTAAPGTRFEYSNLGYAMLGRIVSNVTRRNYSHYVSEQVFAPLGMTATTYENAEVPFARRAIGYRWEDDGWRAEPTMRHGAFGAMGGITTSANDYARWLAFLLSAWPAEGSDRAKATIRSMQYGGGLPQGRTRPGREAQACRIAVTYGAGLLAGHDCTLGQVLFHGGGFPGYGSHMLLIPDAGAGVFALTNRTYSGPSGPVWDAATVLYRAGVIKPRELPVSLALSAAYANARTIWNGGGIDAVPLGALAMNFTMDRDAAHWASLLAARKNQAGDCDTSPAPIATGMLSGRFAWTCAKGTIAGEMLLAPTLEPQIQSLSFTFTPAAK